MSEYDSLLIASENLNIPSDATQSVLRKYMDEFLRREQKKYHSASAELSTVKNLLAASEARCELLEVDKDAFLNHAAQSNEIARDVAGAHFAVAVQGRLALRERFSGEVVTKADEEVVVLWEMEDAQSEQTYDKVQFIGEKLPNVGDKVTALGLIFVEDPKQQKSLDEILKESDSYPGFEDAGS